MENHAEFVERVGQIRNYSPNRQASSLYQLTKEIDGRPEGTGTFPLFTGRVTKLLFLANDRRYFYEPLSSYDDILEAIVINRRLIEGEVPIGVLSNISVSVRLFESVYATPFGRVTLPQPNEREQGIHNVSVNPDWIEGGNALRFRNSWGENWGNRGFGVVSRQYLEHYMVEAWIARSAQVGPTRLTRPFLVQAKSPEDYARAWMRDIPGAWILNAYGEESIINHHGGKCIVRIHETLSTSNDPVEMLELWNGSGTPVGWVHVHHASTHPSSISVCKEFFVLPQMRNMGYRQLLERSVTDRARKWGSEKLRIMFHEADDYPGSTATAKLFATNCGYEWAWVYERRPNISAVAEKVL